MTNTRNSGVPLNVPLSPADRARAMSSVGGAGGGAAFPTARMLGQMGAARVYDDGRVLEDVQVNGVAKGETILWTSNPALWRPNVQVSFNPQQVYELTKEGGAIIRVYSISGSTTSLAAQGRFKPNPGAGFSANFSARQGLLARASALCGDSWQVSIVSPFSVSTASATFSLNVAMWGHEPGPASTEAPIGVQTLATISGGNGGAVLITPGSSSTQPMPSRLWGLNVSVDPAEGLAGGIVFLTVWDPITPGTAVSNADGSYLVHGPIAIPKGTTYSVDFSGSGPIDTFKGLQLFMSSVIGGNGAISAAGITKPYFFTARYQ